VRDRVLELVKRPHGLFFVTGPTGSGKTTTLYSCLALQDHERCKVISIEDGVEYQLDGVHQIAVDPGRGLSFPAAIRHALRMDPDVICCSEVRDVETATLLLMAALSGHLVFSCLHAPDAVEGVMRLLDMGLEPHLLADGLTGVLGQRLIRRLVPGTSREAPEQVETLRREFGDRVPPGCVPKEPGDVPSGGTGYRGRMALQDLLVVTPEVRRVIQRKPTITELELTARAESYRSMRENALDLIAAGSTSLTEALRVCPPRR
jgi:general secretion pathway protein E